MANKQKKKQPKQQQMQKRRSPKGNVSMQAPPSSMYSNDERRCAAEYGESILNPFKTSLEPCLPTLPAIESGPLCVFAEGTGAIGTAGTGGIVGFPCAANNAGQILVTQTAFAAGRLPQVADIGVGVTNEFNNSPHIAADFGGGSKLQSRLVSMGIELWYTGTNLNKSGEYIALIDPDHDSVEGMTAAVILARKRRQRISVGTCKTSCKVVYTPRFPEDYVYNQSFTGNKTSDGFMGILINGVAGQTFGWRIVSHFELIGVGVRNARKVHACSPLVEKVLGAVNNAPATVATGLDPSRVKQAIDNVLSNRPNRPMKEKQQKGYDWSQMASDALMFGGQLIPLFL
jgi:hypothetical protein